MRNRLEAEIDVALDASPFNPFNLLLTSGDRYLIENPAMLVVSETVAFYYHSRSERHTLFKLNRLVAIEYQGTV
jgi:hypothetical protein